MKKHFKVLFLLAFALLLASPAFALQCKTGQSQNADECWTDVYVSPLETSPVSIGTLLVYDFNAGTPEKAGFQVIVSSASADGYRAAGFAQNRITTGDWGRVLVRGRGFVITDGIVASGDRLFSGAPRRGSVGIQGPPTAVATHDPVLAFAVEANTGLSTTDAYITVI